MSAQRSSRAGRDEAGAANSERANPNWITSVRPGKAHAGTMAVWVRERLMKLSGSVFFEHGQPLQQGSKVTLRRQPGKAAKLSRIIRFDAHPPKTFAIAQVGQ